MVTMAQHDGEPLYTRLLEVGLAIEAIEQGWTSSSAAELEFYLIAVLPGLVDLLNGVAPQCSAWLSSPVRELKRLLAKEPGAIGTASKAAQIQLWAKTLKCGLVAAFLKVKYSDFCDSESALQSLWDIDNIAGLDDHDFLMHKTFLHFSVNAKNSKRSWSCPSRKPAKHAHQVDTQRSQVKPSAVTETVATYQPKMLGKFGECSKPLTGARGRWADEVCEEEEEEGSTSDYDDSGFEVDAHASTGPNKSSQPSSGCSSGCSRRGDCLQRPPTGQSPSSEQQRIPSGQSMPNLGPQDQVPTEKTSPLVAFQDKRWWVQLPDLCPLSRFPVKLLPYPPFRLYNRSVVGSDQTKTQPIGEGLLVDGLILVLQVIKTMKFSVLGEDLTSGETRALDYHMKHCKLGPFRLQVALDLRETAQTSQEKAQELKDLRSRASKRLVHLRTLQQRRKKDDSSRVRPC